MPVSRVTRPYLNFLVKPRFFSGFLEKNIILYILKGNMPFKMHTIIVNKNTMPETHLFFHLALLIYSTYIFSMCANFKLYIFSSKAFDMVDNGVKPSTPKCFMSLGQLSWSTPEPNKIHPSTMIR